MVQEGFIEQAIESRKMDTVGMIALLQIRYPFPEGVSLVTVGLVVLLMIAAFLLREAIKRYLNR